MRNYENIEWFLLNFYGFILHSDLSQRNMYIQSHVFAEEEYNSFFPPK